MKTWGVNRWDDTLEFHVKLIKFFFRVTYIT